MVNTSDDARNRELLLRQQRDHEVVFVVPRCGHHAFARRQHHGIEHVELACIPNNPVDVVIRFQHVDELFVLLDHYDVMPVGLQILGHVTTYVAAPRDGDPHGLWAHSGAPTFFNSSPRSDSSALTTEMWRMSPSWIVRSLAGSRGTPNRLIATTRRRPSRSR